MAATPEAASLLFFQKLSGPISLIGCSFNISEQEALNTIIEKSNTVCLTILLLINFIMFIILKLLL